MLSSLMWADLREGPLHNGWSQTYSGGLGVFCTSVLCFLTEAVKQCDIKNLWYEFIVCESLEADCGVTEMIRYFLTVLSFYCTEYTGPVGSGWLVLQCACRDLRTCQPYAFDTVL